MFELLALSGVDAENDECHVDARRKRDIPDINKDRNRIEDCRTTTLKVSRVVGFRFVRLDLTRERATTINLPSNLVKCDIYIDYASVCISDVWRYRKARLLCVRLKCRYSCGNVPLSPRIIFGQESTRDTRGR